MGETRVVYLAVDIPAGEEGELVELELTGLDSPNPTATLNSETVLRGHLAVPPGTHIYFPADGLAEGTRPVLVDQVLALAEEDEVAEE